MFDRRIGRRVTDLEDLLEKCSRQPLQRSLDWVRAQFASTFKRRGPVNIHLTRSRYVYSKPETILAWLDEWQRSQGFQSAAEETDSLTMKRGSHWSAAFTFDIRKIPSTLSVSVEGEYPCLLTIELRCKSPLAMQTPGDKGKLEKDLNLLEDFLWLKQKSESYQDAAINPNLPRSASCGSHSTRSGISLCERCGQFLCHACRGTERHCIACIQRESRG